MTPRYSDCLRGLMDAASFLRILSVFGSGAAPTDRCAAIVIDVDQAEALNARLHDSSGDSLMRLLIGRANAALPLQAIAGRIRPHAIALLMFSNISDEEAETVCTAVHDAVRSPLTGGGEQVTLSVSIGVAFTGPRTSAITALQYAEQGVQRVKANGGDATFCCRSTGAFTAFEIEAAA